MNENTVKACYRFLAHQGRGLTELRAIEPRGVEPPVQAWVDGEGAFVEFCKRWEGKRQIYVGINPRARKGGTREDIDEVTTIVLDVDAVRPDKHQPATDAELKCAEKVADRIIVDFTERGFKAPVKCCSGNGWQLWLAIPPINAAVLGRDLVEGKVQEFQKRVKVKYEDEHATIDNIGDLPRVVRVIGTINIKGKPTPERPHRLSYACGDFTRREDPLLRDYILSLEPPQPPKFISQPARLSDDRVRAILNKSSIIKRLYEQGPTDGDRSVADYTLTCHLIKHGAGADQIRDVLLSTSWSKVHDVKKVGDPERYFRLTYEHASTAVADEIEIGKIAKKQNKTGGRQVGPKIVKSLDVPGLIDIVLTKDGAPAYLIGSEPRLEEQVFAEDVIMVPPKPRWLAPTDAALDHLNDDDFTLFEDVEDYVYAHVDLSDKRQYSLMAAYAMVTWVYGELFDSLPFLLFLGPYSSGKTRALEILARLCWRPVLSSTLGEANIFRPTEIFKPTLLIDEMDLTARSERGQNIVSLLRARQRRGLTVMRINPEKSGLESIEWYKTYGPTAIASTKDIVPDLKSRCLVFGMLEKTRPVKKRIDERRGQELRDRLLAFKIRHMGDPKDEPHEELDFLKSGRLEELFSPLVRICKICKKTVRVSGAMTKALKPFGMRVYRPRVSELVIRKAVIGRAPEFQPPPRPELSV
ncbi:hypothetical protein ES703_31673 [subsurface metagenome]